MQMYGFVITTPVSLPFPLTAFRRFDTEAKAQGVSLEAYLCRLSELGFGVPVGQLLENVFSDAAAEIAVVPRAGAFETENLKHVA